ncbi:MAG: hypothetical protein MAGBODY4_00375 [Candidatus Marinimicrobia bacterium]|nr:hypothetical protein [Candidatus Neomarinimicrobiota bacterium]
MALSLKFVKQHFESNPDSPIFAYYADLLLRGGDTAGAYQVCSDGLEQYPEFATGWFVFGKISRERGEPEFAKTCWMRTMSNDHMALNAAVNLLELDDIELADEEVRTAARLILAVDSEHTLAGSRLEELSAREEAEPEPEIVEAPQEEPEEEEISEPEDISEETEEEEAEHGADFTPPEFEAEVLEEGEELTVEKPEGDETKQIDTAADVLQYSEEDEGLDFDIFDVEPEEIESVMEVLRSRLGEDFDTAEVSRETINAIRDELREKRAKSREEQVEGEAPDSLYDEIADEIEEVQEEVDVEESETSEIPSETEEPVREAPAIDSTGFMPEQDSIKITERMATFTFAEVLKNQGLYEQAYQVLELMRNKSDELEHIETEQAELKELIEAKRESDRTRE